MRHHLVGAIPSFPQILYLAFLDPVPQFSCRRYRSAFSAAHTILRAIRTHTQCTLMSFRHDGLTDNNCSCFSNSTYDHATETHRSGITMCFYEKTTFLCGHVQRRLMKHCHFARNDPGHQCFGAWNDKREWNQLEVNCADCTRRQVYLTATCHAQSTYGVGGGK